MFKRMYILRKLPVIFIVAVLVLSSAVAVIAYIPNESFPLRGTFYYDFWVGPIYQNDTYPNVGRLFESGDFIYFWYGSNYQIFGPEFSNPNVNKLKVSSGNNDHLPNVVLNIGWENSSRPNRGGALFEASTFGLDIPYDYRYGYGAGFSVVNVTDVILQNNVPNDTIQVSWSLEFKSIIATFAEGSYGSHTDLIHNYA